MSTLLISAISYSSSYPILLKRLVDTVPDVIYFTSFSSFSSSLALQPNAGLCLHNEPPPNLWSEATFQAVFLRGGVVNPTPNPQPGGTGPIFITPGTA